MNSKTLFFIVRLQKDPAELFNCSKKFTIGRWYDLRCKNRIYFRDCSIKVMKNCYHPSYHYIQCKEIWYKNGKLHRDEVDPETGITFPTIIFNDGTKEWYKDDKYHRDEVDHENGLTLPAIIWNNGTKYWWKDGKIHRDEVDPETGMALPAIICINGTKMWYKDGKVHHDEVDPETGLTLPAIIWSNGRKDWLKNGKYHPQEMQNKNEFYFIFLYKLKYYETI